MRFSLVFRISKHFFFLSVYLNGLLVIMLEFFYFFEFDIHCFVLYFLLRISSNTHSLNILYFAVHPLVPLL